MGSPDTAKCHYEPLSQGAAKNGDKVDYILFNIRYKAFKIQSVILKLRF